MSLEAKDLILMAQSLGFSRVGVVDLDSAQALSESVQRYREWLAKGYAGQMDYLARHADLRAQPHALLASDSTHLRAIVVTMDYLDSSAEDWRLFEEEALNDPQRAVVSIYARGRDYHKVLRTRLTRLADQLSQQHQGEFQFRACVDSAPVLEVELARRCGLGWRGKHTLLLNRQQGSLFFLGVLLTNMPLSETHFEPALEEAPQGHCGSCTSCMDLCPTGAFVGPYELDARRCISYLTIEHQGSIPENLRPLMGNRVYGCDDCQRVCPWNRYAQTARLDDFRVRHGLDQATLITLFSWTEDEFTTRHQGSAILRIGYLRWLRNLAVGMGNALASIETTDQQKESIRNALQEKQQHESELVREHVAWALAQDAQHPRQPQQSQHSA